MVDDILQIIGTNVSTANPTYQTFFVGGRMQESGKIVRYVNAEGEYQGLGDTNSNYFYIRYNGLINDIEVDGADRVSSCNNSAIEVPLRLVSWINNGDSDKVAKALHYDLSNMNLNITGYTYIKPLVMLNTQMDDQQVYKDETDKDVAELPIRGLSLLYIDFQVECAIANGEACIDRNFCDIEC